jgi:cobaltochelatase CobS
MEHKLKGYQDANGRYVSTQFRQAFEEGGLYLADEIDSWLPSATMGLQAAIANGHCDFPDGRVTRHPDFVMMVGANTVGTGATVEYSGRNKMDAAFLDRFEFLSWGIDEALERAIAGNDKWVSYVQGCRARALAKGIKNPISPRASISGAKLLAKGIAWDQVATSCVRKSLTAEQWAGVKG